MLTSHANKKQGLKLVSKTKIIICFYLKRYEKIQLKIYFHNRLKYLNKQFNKMRTELF